MVRGQFNVGDVGPTSRVLIGDQDVERLTRWGDKDREVEVVAVSLALKILNEGAGIGVGLELVDDKVRTTRHRCRWRPVAGIKEDSMAIREGIEVSRD